MTACCALALAPVACDGDGDSGEGSAESGAGTEETGGDDGSGPGGDDDGSGSAGDGMDDTADADTGEDTGPVGMGEDPPTFDCANATGTLDKKFFTVSPDYNDVMMLDGISVINGNVDINESNYNNLDFLNCITSITGDLTVFGNPFLVDAAGLNNLETLGGTYGGDFIFTKNAAIENFNGMAKLAQIATSPNPDFPGPGEKEELYHSLVMNDNESLKGVNGFDNFKVVFGNITIRDNPVLEHIDGLKGLLAVGLTLAISHNESLCQSSVNSVGAGIQQPCIAGAGGCECDPATVPCCTAMMTVDPACLGWTTQANEEGC